MVYTTIVTPCQLHTSRQLIRFSCYVIWWTAYRPSKIILGYVGVDFLDYKFNHRLSYCSSVSSSNKLPQGWTIQKGCELPNDFRLWFSLRWFLTCGAAGAKQSNHISENAKRFSFINGFARMSLFKWDCQRRPDSDVIYLVTQWNRQYNSAARQSPYTTFDDRRFVIIVWANLSSANE